MNTKKILSVVAASAMALSISAVSASAADWSQSSYADDDPDTCNIISTDENGVTAQQTSSGAKTKVRLTLNKILKNPDDASKIYSGTYKVTYTGLDALDPNAANWVGGGLYAATTNSTTFGVSPATDDEGAFLAWDHEITLDDDFKYLLPSQVPTDASTAEFVFMDWSGQDLLSAGVTVTFSDLHLYDSDGNELEQLGYGEYAGDDAIAVEATEDTTEDTSVDESSDSSTDAATDAAPASDDTTDSSSTGNVSAAAIAGVMAVAAGAAVAMRKRK